MVHQQDDQNSGQVNTNPSVTPVGTDDHTSAVNKNEDSSSSSTSSQDIDDDDFFQIEGPILGSTISFGENASVKEIRQHDGSSSNPETDSPTGPKQSPPAQAMSRVSDECPDPKRIPSSVFSRSKSSTPADWSVTSNESLFSINVGNASFSKDHFFMYGKSGELDNPNDPLAPLPPLPRPSPTSSPMKSEVVKTTGLTGAKIKPTATKDGDPDATDENTDYIHSMSHRSDASTTSFAFPILAGDTRSSEPLKDDQPELARQSTAQLTEQAEPQIQQESPKVEDEAPKNESSPTPAPAPAPAPAQESTPASTQQPPASTKWFPWCSCCPSCC